MEYRGNAVGVYNFGGEIMRRYLYGVSYPWPNTKGVGGKKNTDPGRMAGRQSVIGARAAAFWTEKERREWFYRRGPGEWRESAGIQAIREYFAGMTRAEFAEYLEKIRLKADAAAMARRSK